MRPGRVRMLRHYHEISLLTPAQSDPQTGYRVHSVVDVRDALLVHQLRRAGYRLEQIAPLIAQSAPPEASHRLSRCSATGMPASRPAAAPCSPEPPHWTPTSAADRPRPEPGRVTRAAQHCQWVPQHGDLHRIRIRCWPTAEYPEYAADDHLRHRTDHHTTERARPTSPQVSSITLKWHPFRKPSTRAAWPP